MMRAEEIRTQLENEVDRVIAEVRGDDYGFLLSQGYTQAEAVELMAAKDSVWQEWRAEVIAELWGRTLRFASAPDAPSHAVH